MTTKEMCVEIDTLRGKINNLNKKINRGVYNYLKDVIDEDLSFKVGEKISKLHSADIIHGDITSSNIMLQNDNLVFIDFGLGRYSDLDEDKAVDLLVLKKSLQSMPKRQNKQDLIIFSLKPILWYYITLWAVSFFAQILPRCLEKTGVLIPYFKEISFTYTTSSYKRDIITYLNLGYILGRGAIKR